MRRSPIAAALCTTVLMLALPVAVGAQTPPGADLRLYTIPELVSPERLEGDIDLFGVASVDTDGNESVVVLPNR